MLFTCVPDIWQVLESNQDRSSPDLIMTASMPTCSDNYKAKQQLTNTISPDPISDPIGAVLDYFGLLYEDDELEQPLQHTLNKQIKTPDCRTEQTQIQIKNETETKTSATQDITTRDLIAPGVRTADEHHTQVFAETVESLQATISEPRVQYFPSDLYEAQFDPACIELLPNCRDPIKISDQITCQESKYSLCDFDAGPPLKSGSSDDLQLRDILNGGNVSIYLHEFSHLSLNQSRS